jgi:hypothetical protein
MQGDIMLETFLELNEPALESKFAIEAEFQKKNVLDGIPPKEKFVQCGKDNGMTDGIVCFMQWPCSGPLKMKKREKIYGVLQNFWRGGYLYFKLVTTDYLSACDATI